MPLWILLKFVTQIELIKMLCPVKNGHASIIFCNFPEFYMVFHDFMGFSVANMIFKEFFSMIVPDFPRFFHFIHVFNVFCLRFNEIYWDFPCFLWFYIVFCHFREFNSFKWFSKIFCDLTVFLCDFQKLFQIFCFFPGFYVIFQNFPWFSGIYHHFPCSTGFFSVMGFCTIFHVFSLIVKNFPYFYEIFQDNKEVPKIFYDLHVFTCFCKILVFFML